MKPPNLSSWQNSASQQALLALYPLESSSFRSLNALKTFYSNVKDAPSDIRDLLHEIEVLNIVFSEIREPDAECEIAPASVARSLELCRRGVNLMSGVVTELDKEVGRRRGVGAVKAVLKMGTVRKFTEGLRSAQSLLVISNQIYAQ